MDLSIINLVLQLQNLGWSLKGETMAKLPQPPPIGQQLEAFYAA